MSMMCSMTMSIEQRRILNIQDNKRILQQLGLLNPYRPLPKVIKKTPKRKRESSGNKSRKVVITSTVNDEVEGYGSTWNAAQYGVRRSSRIQGKEAPDSGEINKDVTQFLEEETPRLRAPPNRPNIYGPIPGVEVGTTWQTRMEACIAGVQRPTVAGIHAGPDGAFSLALSGGYEDDIDMGDCFTYTGEGGRDLKGTKGKPKNLRIGPQSRDQMLVRGNLALSRSVETRNPVRVLRGYKLDSVFAPTEGYRYDGLYCVEKYWFTTGMSGYGVYKFALRRLGNQAPPPWDFVGLSDTGSQSDSGLGSDADILEADGRAERLNTTESVKLEDQDRDQETTNNASETEETKSEQERDTEDKLIQMETEEKKSEIKEEAKEDSQEINDTDDIGTKTVETTGVETEITEPDIKSEVDPEPNNNIVESIGEM